MRERRERIATAILSGLSSQINCSKIKKGIFTEASDQDYINKALELADMLIAELDKNNEDDGPLKSF